MSAMYTHSEHEWYEAFMPSFMVGVPSACRYGYHHAMTVYEHGVVNKNSKATSEASVLQRMDTVIKARE